MVRSKPASAEINYPAIETHSILYSCSFTESKVAFFSSYFLRFFHRNDSTWDTSWFFFTFIVHSHTVAQYLGDGLRNVATNSNNQKLIENLYTICQTASRVKSQNTFKLSFGPWDKTMLFPEVALNGQKIMTPKYRFSECCPENAKLSERNDSTSTRLTHRKCLSC